MNLRLVVILQKKKERNEIRYIEDVTYLCINIHVNIQDIICLKEYLSKTVFRKKKIK